MSRHWTERVLAAFRDASLANDDAEPGMLTVVLPLAEDADIEFRRTTNASAFWPLVYQARAKSFNSNRDLVEAAVLVESNNLSKVIAAVERWRGEYRDAMKSIDVLLTEAEKPRG